MQVFSLSDGVLLSYKSNLHSRSITAIMFFSALKYLLTAAKDGTGKLYLCVCCYPLSLARLGI